MNSGKQRRSILAVLNEYGRNVPMRSDANVPHGRLYVFDDVLVGCPATIKLAMDIRDNVYVPDKYDDEASTWA